MYVTPESVNCSYVDNPSTYTIYGIYNNYQDTTSCTGNLFVNDQLPPVAIGEISIDVILDSNGQYTFAGEELDDGSYDNCEIESYTVSPSSVDCSSPNPTQATLTVTDPSGNTNQVVVMVNIDYNNSPTLACDQFGVLNVLGGPFELTPEYVLEGGPYTCIDQYFITCQDSDGNPVSCTFDESQVGEDYICIVTDFQTGNSCWSEFDVIASGQPYEICVFDFEGGGVKDVELIWGVTTGDNGCSEISTGPGAQISPSLFDNQVNGVDDIDLLIMREYILSINPNIMGEQILAGDINNNGDITTLDLVLLEKALLGEYDMYASWVFIHGEYDFQVGEMPTNFNQYITIGDDSNYDFRGIKIGDLDLSYEQIVSEDDKVSLLTSDIVLNKGEFYNIPITMSQAADLVVANVQFPAETPEYRVTNITSSIESYVFDPELDINENIARFRWLGLVEAEFGGITFEEGDALFTVEIEALDDGILHNTFILENTTSGNKWKEAASLKGESLKLVYSNIITVDTEENILESVTIHPNPVTDQLIIELPSSITQAVEYDIFDISGRVITQGESDSNKAIMLNNLSSGLYIIQISTPYATVSRNFVKN